MKKTILIALILSMSLGTILYIIFNFEDTWIKNESLSSIIIAATALGGVAGVIVQFNREKNLREVDFIVKFNTKFLEFDELIDVLNYCSHKAGIINDPKYDEVTSLNHTDVYKYLDYFEPLYFLLKNKAVSIDKMYMLVSHRFFVVVCNPDVQNNVLAKHQTAFKSIIEMYRILDDYRCKKKIPLPSTVEENGLLKFLDTFNY
ncbi:MAG: hypothetical protein FWD48_11635 [Oscillospiraceae bacterium]|nr:hypothetical protein [Oscillospiraceae bacterium]